eukprot:9906-Heterococcus_DN1.PRE.2
MHWHVACACVVLAVCLLFDYACPQWLRDERMDVQSWQQYSCAKCTKLWYRGFEASVEDRQLQLLTTLHCRSNFTSLFRARKSCELSVAA